LEKGNRKVHLILGSFASFLARKEAQAAEPQQ
jgi:hypothetical protein